MAMAEGKCERGCPNGMAHAHAEAEGLEVAVFALG